ncbi:serine protease SohB [Hasllibacter halocynthiae]|uniref:Serine protease SohB n=1 Tax=Hasllibacter halocynthiae TaxID=595589 RepID=A0A2T0X3R8_9RHOB|nr:S49 family peptidase [Hasllibacter halocynthiae]PRY93589.1 serine protease SohB [Hasllibacter halocynthiae]
MRWNPFAAPKPIVAVVRLSGAIAQGTRGTLNDAGIGPVLERAFAKGKPKAVALQINSPGGSPVQSSLIGARIRRLSEKHGVPVHAFVEDVAASGGYWLACAADDIWTDASSITGSIGVISAGFGLEGLIGRYGIERRVHTAGESKSKLDPFRPEDPQDVARLRELLEQIHQSFIAHVKARRGARLSDDPRLFTGEIWVGETAHAVGLTDGVAHLEPKMRALYGKDIRFRRYGQRRPFLRRFGAGLADGAAGRLDAMLAERAMLARFGL